MIPIRDNIKIKTFPYVNWLIISMNFYFFFIELNVGNSSRLDQFIKHWGVVPKALWSHFSREDYTLVSATFLHGGWMHLMSNMLFLFVFGGSVEDRVGHFRFLVFFLIAGIIANGSQAYFTPQSSIPLIGASGAIAGVLGSYFFYYPYAQVETLIPIFFFITIRNIPAFIFLGFWFLLQTFSSTFSITAMCSGHSMGGVAFIAHAVGFVSGLIMAPVFGRKPNQST